MDGAFRFTLPVRQIKVVIGSGRISQTLGERLAVRVASSDFQTEKIRDPLGKGLRMGNRPVAGFIDQFIREFDGDVHGF